MEGTVPSEIIKTLLASDADLLVIGTQGVHRGLDHLLLGSNSEALMLGSPCPTVTVGPHVSESLEPSVACQKVIYISDFSIALTTTATFADKLGSIFGVETEVYQLASKAAKPFPSRCRGNPGCRTQSRLPSAEPQRGARQANSSRCKRHCRCSTTALRSS